MTAPKDGPIGRTGNLTHQEMVQQRLDELEAVVEYLAINSGTTVEEIKRRLAALKAMAHQPAK